MSVRDQSRSGCLMKRCFDIAVSAIGLTLFAPVMLVLGVIVKIQTPGPAIYSQERIGYRQKPFNIYKLRSMIDGAECGEPLLSGGNDSRITPIGRFMRRYHLDELPNFWNVLKGDMSVVGPRPERKFFIDKIVEVTPEYTLLHQVRPGLTSLGMVKWGYASTIEELIGRMRYDIVYVRNISPSLDFKILFYTFHMLIKGEGV